MKRALLLAVMLSAALGACGDNGNNNNGGKDAGSGSNLGGSDGGMPAATLTSYVIDLVQNHTTATDLPRPYTEFQNLPDPDGSANNGSAYSSLF